MRLNHSVENKKFDLRLRDKNLSSGKLQRKDLDGYLEKLQDDAGNCTTVGEKAQKPVNGSTGEAAEPVPADH